MQTVPPREALQSQPLQAQIRTADGKRHVVNFPRVVGSNVIGLRAVAEAKSGAGHALHERQFTQRYDTLRFALADVSAVAVPKTSPGRTVLFFGAAAAFISTVLGAAGSTSGN